MICVSKYLRKFFLDAKSINFYFLILTLALFLGDGKQAIVDIFLSFCVAVWAIFIFIYQKKLRNLPRPVYFGWWGIILYIAIRLFFSASPGLSFTYLVRMLLAFVSFYTLYCFTPLSNVEKFISGLKTFVTFACLAALGLILWPGLSGQIPSMSLLYATFGHNHLSGLILLVLPFVVGKLINKPKKYGIIWMIFIFLMLVLSFGRLSLFIVIGYLMFVLINKYQKLNFHVRSVLFLLIISLISFLIILYITSQKTQAGNTLITSNNWLNRQINKSFSISGFRGRYWQQAFTAFKTRPFFGTGPGTFSLSSKKYQSTPATYSFYAHSFPLEFLSENGVAGIFILGYLLFSIAKNILKINRQSLFIIPYSNTNTLFSGVILVFLYSAVDFNLNFIVIWLLFWSSLAILSINKTNKPVKLRTTNYELLTINISISILLFFYLTALSGLVVTVPDNLPAKSWAFYFAPYDQIRAKNLIEFAVKNNTVLSRNEINLINFFHKQDPDILFDKIKYLDQQKDSYQVNQLYKQLLTYDPQNWFYHKSYLEYLKKTGQKESVASELGYLSSVYLDRKVRNLITGISFSDPVYANILYGKIGLEADGTQINLLLAKLFYFSGLEYFKTNPLMTEKLWTISRDIAPTWGYFHMELAALEYFHFHNNDKTADVLANCQKYEFVSSWCLTVSRDLTTLPQIESLAKNILAIPQILK